MTTTTFAEKLLAKAQQLEDDAAALRRAAQVMNGHGLAAKQGTMAATVKAAAKLRQQQANGNGNGHAPQPPADAAGYREARGQAQHELITAQLAEGPQRTADIAAHLKAHGIAVSQARVLQLVRGMPGVVMRGKGTKSRWQLAHEPRSQPDTPEALSDHAATNKRRAEKANVIIEILRTAGKPLRIRDLSALAREQGIDSLTGIVGLVRNGTLASRGTGSKRTYRLATP
jgi:hypothetical protein